jgi:thiamine-phosphate pyrophosphorylase
MDIIPSDILRIIDANLNRAGEGIRVLEEFARMSLNDTRLTQRLKNVRHSVLVTDTQLQARLVEARDPGHDIGAGMKAPGQDEQADAGSIIVANARRAQESLRVLEESAKAYDMGVDTDIYKKARFELYDIEKELLSIMLRQDKLDRLRGLYVIIDTEALKGRDHVEAASQVIGAGAGIIQLRDKKHKKKELIGIAAKIGDLCRKHGVLFIVNDYLDVALSVDADGLHVGAEDLPPGTARRLLPADKILGCSVRTVESARMAVAEGADYLGVGGMYPTASKENNEVIGAAGLREIRKAVEVPLVAIGGINKDNVPEVIDAGADAIAVISAVLGSSDIEEAARQISEIIKGVSHG